MSSMQKKIPHVQFEKYANRLKYLEELIHKQGTGTPRELAVKLSISERMLYYYMDSLKSGERTIRFCRKRKSYIFSPLT